MGMFDTINGEQVKCFPWVSLYHGVINYHGGYLKYYGTGDEVPYKKPHFNYGKNFIILDLNRFQDSDYADYDYIIHVIVDGKVKDTFKNTLGEINWSINETVVGYVGDILNIKSSEDLIEYMKDQRKYWDDYDNIRSKRNELFREMMHYSYGIGLLNKESEERKNRLEKIAEIRKLMNEEDERINHELDRISKQYSKWSVDTSDIDDLINLGEYISAYNIKREDNGECKERILKLLASDKSLYERYVKWQGTDEYIKEFAD